MNTSSTTSDSELRTSNFGLNTSDFETGTALLVNKPIGWTSFDVVNKIRYALRKKLQKKNIKVGHAGTLDPLATGLLIICTGKMTKEIDSFMGMSKTYTGVITLGGVTPSYDLETPISQTFPIQHINPEVIETARKQFIGKILQQPPMFSAIKIDGKRLYESARKNEIVEVPSRTIEIEAFDILSQHPNPNDPNLIDLAFSIRCSKGTYIRSIANDFGAACQSGAYLSALCRTHIGNYALSDAWDLEKLISHIL